MLFARGSTALPLVFRFRAKRSPPPSIGSIGDSSRPVRRCDSRVTDGRRRAAIPTTANLLIETDAQGRQRNYLASEESFQFLKLLHARDQIVPVVGDVSRSSAMAAVARLIRGRGERLSAFYTSNVEDYLFRDGRFQKFVQNLGGIPHDDRSVVIESIFSRWLSGARPGDLSTRGCNASTSCSPTCPRAGSKLRGSRRRVTL